jgi:predicted nucleic acid-binding protein
MPTTAVLDASFVMATFIPHPKAMAALAIIDQLREADIPFIAPSLWIYEVTAGIHKLAYFKEISALQAESALALAERFSIMLVIPDFSLARRAIRWSQRLQRASTYDSFYLALAQERGCDLWTADVRLANAVNENWVRLLV